MGEIRGLCCDVERQHVSQMHEPLHREPMLGIKIFH